MTPAQLILCAEEIQRTKPDARIVPDVGDTRLAITDGAYRYYGYLDVCEGTVTWEQE